MTCAEPTRNAAGRWSYDFSSNALSARLALKHAMTELETLPLSADQHAASEIVLAEVINNIIRHAYNNRDGGAIRMTLNLGLMQAHCAFIDEGGAMPDGRMPAQKIHDLSCQTADLPESGFGWSLIREFAEDIRYSRRGLENHLSFTLKFGDS